MYTRSIIQFHISKFTEKMAFFIISIDSLYLQELVVQLKKSVKKFYILKILKTVTISIEVMKTRPDIDYLIFVLALYVTKSTKWAS